LYKQEVLKVMKVAADMKGEDMVVLHDLTGKVYFLDKNEPMRNIEVGTILYTWVVSDKEKAGYVRITIDGMLINDYIKNIPNLRDQDYYVIADENKRPDSLYFAAQMFNSDSDFKSKLKEKSFKLGKYQSYVNEHYEKFRTNNLTERDIKRKAIVDSYLLSEIPLMQ